MIQAKRSWMVELRKKAGLSRAALARALGVTVATIGFWETGFKAPDRENMFVLAHLIGDDVVGAFAAEAMSNRLRPTGTA